MHRRGVTAGVAAGMTVIGFAGASHGSDTANQFLAVGARDVITELRALKRTIIDLAPGNARFQL